MESLMNPTVLTRTMVVKNEGDDRCPHLGLDLPGLAEHFGVSQKILALRLGEALGMPIALYQAGDKRRARSSVAYRGPYAIAPPNELAKVIAAGGARGMQVFWLSDRVGTALVVGEAL